MYDAIRQLISENRLSQALREMQQLDLSREHASRLVTIQRRHRILENKAMGNLIEERLIRIEENGIVEDMLLLLDHAEHPLPDGETTAPAGIGAGAGASSGSANTGNGRNTTGTGDGRTTTQKLLPYLLGGGALLLLAVFWFSRPDPEPTPASPATEARTEATLTQAERDEIAKQERIRLEEERKQQQEKERLAREQADASQPSTSTATRPSVTLSNATLEKLKEAQTSQVETGQVLQVDPSILAKQDLRRLVPTALMTSGPQVHTAVAVYRNKKAPTAYDASLTASLTKYLDQTFQGSIQGDVLTDVFHKLEGRDRLQMRGLMTDDRLKVDRAKYLLLVDVRNVNLQGKADLRMCLYDVARGKGFTRGKQIDIGTSSRLKEKELIYQTVDYLKEMNGRGLYDY